MKTEKPALGGLRVCKRLLIKPSAHAWHDGDADGVSAGFLRGERVLSGVQEVVRGVAESVSLMGAILLFINSLLSATPCRYVPGVGSRANSRVDVFRRPDFPVLAECARHGFPPSWRLQSSRLMIKKPNARAMPRTRASARSTPKLCKTTRASCKGGLLKPDQGEGTVAPLPAQTPVPAGCVHHRGAH